MPTLRCRGPAQESSGSYRRFALDESHGGCAGSKTRKPANGRFCRRCWVLDRNLREAIRSAQDYPHPREMRAAELGTEGNLWEAAKEWGDIIPGNGRGLTHSKIRRLRESAIVHVPVLCRGCAQPAFPIRPATLRGTLRRSRNSVSLALEVRAS